MAEKREIKGYNWGIFGGMDTGKTYITMEDIVKTLHEQHGKRVIIFDHTYNPSYEKYTNLITIEDLKYRLDTDKIYKIQTESEDFDAFCEAVMRYVRNSAIVIDDCATLVNAGLNDTRKKMIRTTKNNFNDVLFQVHSFNEAGPYLIENLQRIVLKEVAQRKIPGKVPWQEYIQYLLQEIILENDARADGNRWAYRIYCVPEKAVVKDKSGLDSKVSYTEFQYFRLYEDYDGRIDKRTLRALAQQNNLKFK